MMLPLIWSKVKYVSGEWWVYKHEAEEKAELAFMVALIAGLVMGFVLGVVAL